jgi:hypothetical protein
MIDEVDSVSEISVQVELSSAGLDASHPAMESAVANFVADVRGTQGLAPSDSGVPVTGKKGSLEAIGVALSSPAAIAALARIVRLWLERDRDRSVDVVVGDAGSADRRIIVSGNNISTASLEYALKAAFEVADRKE